MTDQLKLLLETVAAQTVGEGELSPLLEEGVTALYASPIPARSPLPAVAAEGLSPPTPDAGMAEMTAPAAWERNWMLPAAHTGENGLTRLYRQVADSLGHSIPPAASVAGEDRSAVPGRVEGPMGMNGGSAVLHGLTAQELDRAVRRDSRRYDGGVSMN